MDSAQRQRALLLVIHKHFPDLSDRDANTMAWDLSGNIGIALGLQQIVRSDRDPKKDIESLRLAVKSLHKAGRHIEELGWHGQKQIPSVLKHSLPDPVEHGFIYPDNGTQAQQVLASLLSGLATSLEKAGAEIDEGALSVNSAFQEGPAFEEVTRTKKPETAAKLSACECAKIFFDATGSLPTVRTDYRHNTAYGPFLDFVADSFSACNINASAEAWARHAAKEFSPEK